MVLCTELSLGRKLIGLGWEWYSDVTVDVSEQLDFFVAKLELSQCKIMNTLETINKKGRNTTKGRKG